METTAGRTALHNAAERGDMHAVTILLFKAADFAPLDGSGDTPADLASRNGHEKIAKKIEAVAAVMAKDPKAMRRILATEALMALACRGCDEAAAKKTKKAEAKAARDAKAAAEEREMIRQAVLADDGGQIKAAAEAGADLDAPCVGEFTAIHIAVCHGKNIAVEALLENGASPEGNGAGASPLVSAAEWGNVAAAWLLIEAKADVSAGERGSPLHAAAMHGAVAIAELCLDAGSDVRAKLNGDEPLHLAAASGSAKMIGLLLSRSADANARGAHGDSPLMAAAFAGKTASFGPLILAGADIHAQNDGLQTVIEILEDGDKTEAINLILQLEQERASHGGFCGHCGVPRGPPAWETEPDGHLG